MADGEALLEEGRLLKGLSADDLRAILAARRSGVPYLELERRYGFAASGIRYAVVKLDRTLATTRVGPLPRLSAEERRDLLEARRAGATYGSLARKYGYSNNSIRYAVRRLDPALYEETKRQ